LGTSGFLWGEDVMTPDTEQLSEELVSESVAREMLEAEGLDRRRSKRAKKPSCRIAGPSWATK
jgi:hypothetical protein